MLLSFSMFLDISRLVSFIAFVVLYCHNSAGFCSPLRYTFECGITFLKVSNSIVSGIFSMPYFSIAFDM